VDCIAINNPKNKETRFVQLILEWGEKNKRRFPWRKYRTPYKALVAEILLQRTPANRVAKFFPEFVEKFPSPRSIATTDIYSFKEFLYPMGLKKRAEWLISLMKEVCDKYDCKIPDQEDQLVKLHGVGLYTSRAVLCFGFSKDVSIVDVNVARVLSRVFYGSDISKKPSEDRALWKFAAKVIPKGSATRYNEALLDHAALVCKKNPLCDECPVSVLCDYYIRYKYDINNC
jgi:A/G-specific adenine glycosylase